MKKNCFSIDAAPAVTPFWRNLPRFFSYPIQLASVLRIAGYSLISVLAAVTPDLFSFALRFILWIIFLKYAFLVLARSANGRFDAPNGADGEVGDAAQVMRQYALFLLIGLGATVFGSMFGLGGYYLTSILGCVMLPAATMIIAVTHSLLQSLNPKNILFFIKTIGSPYLALCFFLLSLTSSSQWLQVFLGAHINSWLVWPLISFVEFYFVLIIYHMMGYTIYQYHKELGVNAAVGFENADMKYASSKGRDPVLVQLTELMAQGNEEAAIDLLREALRLRWENNDLHERYQKLLTVSGKTSAAQQHAKEFIVKLVNEKRLFRALDLCEHYLKIDPDFQLQDSFQVHELAAAAALGKCYKLALNLMRRFDRRYPQHPHIPQVFFLSAQIFAEQYRMNKEAIRILHAIQLKFPEHPLAVDAMSYEKTLMTNTIIA
jgi:tetratricopeptide (TPR) repeat protein